ADFGDHIQIDFFLILAERGKRQNTNVEKTLCRNFQVVTSNEIQMYVVRVCLWTLTRAFD
ncbi:MAG TPA: hypothetical protein VM912_17090, partial [Terriglobales bacterium]|nr:hypothetical protein [Terriglobales bacterium]